MRHAVNKLMTWDFWSICSAAFLMHLALFLWLPLLPSMWAQGWGLKVSAFASYYLIYIIGVLMVGPFHAWLADTFKRKYVLMLPLVLLALFPLGCLWATERWQLLALMWGAGCCHGIALSVGNTISIDIAESERRSKANKVFAFVVMLGTLLGVGMGEGLSRWLGFYHLAYGVVFLLVLGLLLVSGIYVAFRAPMGVSRCSLDRFFLPVSWLLAVQMMLLGLVPGLLMPLVTTAQVWWPAGALLFTILLLRPLVVSFVKLSHHCQRATSVHSCLLALWVGLFSGMAISYSIFEEAALQPLALVAGMVAVALLPISRKFFQKYRVRM